MRAYADSSFIRRLVTGEADSPQSTRSLDLGKPEDSLLEMLLCFVQIRV